MLHPCDYGRKYATKLENRQLLRLPNFYRLMFLTQSKNG